MSPDDAAQVADQGHWTRGRGRLDFMTPTPHPPGISRWMWLLSLVIAAFGVGVLVISGQSMLDGDLGASGTGPRWVTHPAAFVAGVVMAFAPLGIWLQAKRQSDAAEGTPVVWTFAEQRAADAFEDRLIDKGIDGIVVKVDPPKEG